jgi:drug/metabolite transporter (DMT)-like permease
MYAYIRILLFQCVKYLEDLCFNPPCNHPPSEFAFARFGVAALVSAPLLFRQRKEVILAGLECGAWISLGYATQAAALSTISAGKCAFICSLTVVVCPILAKVIYGRPIKPGNVLSAIVALSGVAVLEGIVDLNALLGIAPAVADPGAAAIVSTSFVEAASSGPLSSLASMLGIGKGDLLALGQPIGFGYSFLRIEHYQNKFKHVPNRVLTIAAAQCVAVGILSFLWVLYDYHGILPNFGYLIEPHRIATIAWTGIVTTVFAIFLQGIALQKATATDAAITFSSEPVWASLFGFVLLHEQLGPNAYVGGAIIMTACLLGSLTDVTSGAEHADIDKGVETSGDSS